MNAVVAVLVIFLGIPALVYLSDRRRQRRTQAERDDEAVRVAKGAKRWPRGQRACDPREAPWAGVVLVRRRQCGYGCPGTPTRGCTGVTDRNTGPFAEHARNLNGIWAAVTAPGG